MNNKNNKPIWVIGHKNPDTDSICAAISYANLKNSLNDGNTYIPKKAGSLNEETKYVLERFKVQVPETVNTVAAQVKDIEFRRTKGISSHYSMKKAWELMRTEDVVTLPIVNDGGRLEGLIVNGDIAYSYMDVYDNSILGRARTQYKNIIETLNGTLLTGNDHAYFVKGKVVVASGNREAIRQEIEQDDLVILGNVKERQLIALEQNPSCLIVTGVTELDYEVVDKAKSIDCVLITTEYDSFTTARLIHQSMPIKFFMTKKNLVTFELEDPIYEVSETMSKIRHRDFPVLDEQRKYVGMFSRRNLINMAKKNIILVDHNEKSQAVDGIEDAEILEIIDHHRLGSLETIQPIFFRNQPLGCSSTIIYQMYLEKEVTITKQMAGLMLSAILSDTLMFRSPTCTAVDEAAAKELARIAEVDYEELAVSMFEAGSNFKDRTTEEIFYQDFKIFNADDVSFGVAQVSAVSTNQLSAIKPLLQDYLEKVIVDKSLDMVYVLLTNILEQGSVLLYAGPKAEAIAVSAFGEDTLREGYLALYGVVSRKKQVIPKLMEAISKL